MKKKTTELLLELALVLSLIVPVFLFHEFLHSYWIGITTAYLTVVITGRKYER